MNAMSDRTARLIAHHVRMAYLSVTFGELGRNVGLVALRAEIHPDFTRSEVDAVLDRMARSENVLLRGEADQKTLTDTDRAAAVVLGGTARHILLITE